MNAAPVSMWREPAPGKTAPATLWTVCQALADDELVQIRDLAISEDRKTLKRILRDKMSSSVKRGDCARLADELIRMGRSAAATSTIIEPPSPSTIRQLEAIAGLAEASQPRPSWRLEVASSSVAGGGSGVFLHGKCEVLAVLAVYPGVTYTTADLPLMAKHVLEGNHYALFLRNGVIIDGRPDGPSREVFKAAEQRDIAAHGRPPLITESALGVGHMVNHPPRGVTPNVHVLPLDLGRDEHLALHPHLPVVLAYPPVAGEPWKRTAVLVASRELCDEELWLDYKLRADIHRLPEWYAPCEDEDAESGEPGDCESACSSESREQQEASDQEEELDRLQLPSQQTAAVSAAARAGRTLISDVVPSIGAAPAARDRE